MGGFACEPYRCEYFVNYISALNGKPQRVPADTEILICAIFSVAANNSEPKSSLISGPGHRRNAVLGTVIAMAGHYSGYSLPRGKQSAEGDVRKQVSGACLRAMLSDSVPDKA